MRDEELWLFSWILLKREELLLSACLESNSAASKLDSSLFRHSWQTLYLHDLGWSWRYSTVRNTLTASLKQREPDQRSLTARVSFIHYCLYSFLFVYQILLGILTLNLTSLLPLLSFLHLSLSHITQQLDLYLADTNMSVCWHSLSRNVRKCSSLHAHSSSWLPGLNLKLCFTFLRPTLTTEYTGHSGPRTYA